MTPGEASKSGNILVIDHPLGGKRVAAHVFDLSDGGVAFIDSGWTDPWTSSHVAHAVEAKFSIVSIGWGATTEDGDVFLEVHPDSDIVDLEGSREKALAAVVRSRPDLKRRLAAG